MILTQAARNLIATTLAQLEADAEAEYLRDTQGVADLGPWQHLHPLLQEKYRERVIKNRASA